MKATGHMRRRDYLTVGNCKDCGSLLPFMQKNKIAGQDAWKCLKCNAVNEYADTGQRTMWTRHTLIEHAPDLAQYLV